MKKRLASLLMAVVMTLGLLPAVTAPASAAGYSFSSSYMKGPFYQRLKAVKKTGNQINDLIAVAASQLDYHESNDKNELSGLAPASCDKNCTEYGRLTGSNGGAWCASFVSWCFRMAGIPTSVMPSSPTCGNLRRSVYTKGAAWHPVESGYKPQAGDLLMFEAMNSGYDYYVPAKRDKNGVPDRSSHVAIVVSDYDPATKSYGVIEGNGNPGCVHYTKNAKLYMRGPTKSGTCNRVQGFVTPAYTTGTGNSFDGTQVDTTVTVRLTAPTDPKYTAKEFVTERNACVVSQVCKSSGAHISQSGLTLYAADGSKLIEKSEKVTNVGDKTTVFHSWYDINKELDYFLDPGTTYKYRFFAVVEGKRYEGNTYTLRTKGEAGRCCLTFDPQGGRVDTTTKTVYVRDVYGDLPVPTREGYQFEGWYSGSQPITANTLVSTGGSRTLTARWVVDDEVQADAAPQNPDQGGVVPPDAGFVQEDVEPKFAVKKLTDGVLVIDENNYEPVFRFTKASEQELRNMRVVFFSKPGAQIANIGWATPDDYTNAGQTEIYQTLDMREDYLRDPLTANPEGKFKVCCTVEDKEYESGLTPYLFKGVPPAAKRIDVDFWDPMTGTRVDTLAQFVGNRFCMPIVLPSHSGYRFAGWFTAEGAKVENTDTVTAECPARLYAHWEEEGKSAFVDVKDGDWFRKFVNWAVERKITAGTSKNPPMFSPNLTCKNCEIITFIWNSQGQPEPTIANPYTDVKAADWYYKPALWAYEKGMVEGSSFNAARDCTRADAVTYLWRMAGRPDAPAASFNDMSGWSAYAPAVNWAVEAGVTAGNGAGGFSPGEICSRAQIVTFIYNAMK